MGIYDLIAKYKLDLLLYLKYPKRYKDSTVRSYVPESTCVGNKVTIKLGVTLSDTIQRIGDGVYIGDRSTILNVSEIGNYASISHNVIIGVENHRLDALSTNPFFYVKDKGWITKDNRLNAPPTKIEADVLISADCVILSGITLGVGCVIGANSFVNKNVPPYAIVAGSPAKVIKYRFDEATIEELLASKWWEMNMEELKKYEAYFSNPKDFLKKIKQR